MITSDNFDNFGQSSFSFASLKLNLGSSLSCETTKQFLTYDPLYEGLLLYVTINAETKKDLGPIRVPNLGESGRRSVG